MKRIKRLSFLCVILFFMNCGGGQGGTETGSTDFGATALSQNFATMAGQLIPDMSSSGDSSLSKLITFAESSDWDVFLSESNQVYLTDIFGGTEGVAPVTRIRVLLDQVSNDMGTLLSSDTDFSCTGTSLLNEGETLSLPFFGEVSNGTTDNAAFDCTIAPEDSDTTFLYGQDANNVISYASMSNNTSTNTESTSTRGSSVKLIQVVYVKFFQNDTGTTVERYLDLQYTQATIYAGVDESFDTSDDITFKSRTRLTGQVDFDEDNNATLGVGDFSVIKFDSGVNDDHSTYTNTTQTLGRGNYASEQYLLFNIQTTVTSLADQDGNFCLQNSSSGLPVFAQDSNCSDFAEAFPWTGTDIPTSFTTGLSPDFATVTFFAADDEDLIASDGSNFTIPTYTTLTEE